MKTRQELIYDFMLALSGNSEVYKDWTTHSERIGPFADHIYALASELTDEYLRSLS
jgi:hypothetical protein